MKLQKNDIFAAIKDIKRQLNRFKTGVLSNYFKELVKIKGISMHTDSTPQRVLALR